MKEKKTEKKIEEKVEKKIEVEVQTAIQKESTDFKEVNQLVKEGWIVTDIKSEIKESSTILGRPKTWILKEV